MSAKLSKSDDLPTEVSPPDIPNTTAQQLRSLEELVVLSETDGWDLCYRQLEPGQFNAHLQVLHGKSGAVFHMEDYSPRMSLTGTSPADTATVVIPNASGSTLNGLALHALDFVAIGPGAECDLTTQPNAAFDSIHLPLMPFLEACRTLTPSANTLRRGEVRVCRTDPGRKEELKMAFDTALSATLRARRDQEESISILTTEIVALLAGKENELEPDRLPCNGSRRRIAARARDYIEGHMRTTCRMEGLCKHCGAGIRTVQRSVLAEYGLTPMAFTKVLRLHEARRMLAAADPSELSVTTCANDVGISHLGHFSVDYKRLFAESPSITLNRPSRTLI